MATTLSPESVRDLPHPENLRARAQDDEGASDGPSRRSLRGLDGLNFFLADVQTGVGPFLAVYLAAQGWNEGQVGVALTLGGLAGIAAQTPAGALVDRLRQKRTLIASAVIALAMGALVIAFDPSFVAVVAAQIWIGATTSVILPAVAAVSLGLVGAAAFDRRTGRNQSFNSAGNVMAALSMGLIAYYVSNRAIFFLVVAFCLPTLWCLSRIDPSQIDFDAARGSSEPNSDDDKPSGPSGLASLLSDRRLLTFAACATMFHFANAAMLPLLGQMLGKGHGSGSALFMSGCVITTQVVVTLLAPLLGGLAGKWGRKPLLLVGFGAIALRGVLYTLTGSVPLLISIQIFDGIGAAVFGVVSILVIADLTRGTGRFNLAQGAIATAQGVGAAVSQFVGGVIVQRAGYTTGYLFLAGVAAVATILLLVAMPETVDRGSSASPGGV